VKQALATQRRRIAARSKTASLLRLAAAPASVIVITFSGYDNNMRQHHRGNPESNERRDRALTVALNDLCYNQPRAVSENCGNTMLQTGHQAPNFDLPDADMEMVNLAGFRNHHHVVLYFYPKDDTPGCTIEAIDFSELQEEFTRLDAIVLGVSMDDCLSHGSFRDKHGLNVRLLADVDGETCSSYGVLHEKEHNGQKKSCVQRSTFIIDKHGTLKHALYGVLARGHAAQVLDLVRKMKPCK
jgi:peroxiredoxin Q/BCP